MSDIQTLNNEHFNKAAQDYDNMPQVTEMTQRASEVIVQEFTASTSKERVQNASALDFGCGTGLCAFKVAPHVKHVLGVDASEGMLNHLNHKLASQDENKDIHDKIHTVTHMVTQDVPLPEPERSRYLTSGAGFDLVYSSFVMHHIEDVQSIVDTLAQKLVAKDGWLIVLDFLGATPHYHQHQDGHHHGGEDHSHTHHQGHVQAEGEHHGHQRQHHDHEHKHQVQQEGNIQDHFKDEDGKILEFVAHAKGFTPEIFVEIFKKAGLVDVSAKHSFGMYRDMKGRQVWTDVLVAKGRRA
ncbi:hypothetical protein EDD11_006612 [Mortierella claussenii]|nr:hypothetical protein EDD11_006612 [Mortierella claussenii]